LLLEIQNVRQIKDEGHRRWFTDDYFELILWYDDKDLIRGFQLCYDRFKMEKVLTWKRETGYTHDNVDDGEIPGQHKKTPILIKDGIFNRDKIAERFKKESAELDIDISKFVYDKLLEYRF